MTTSTFEPLSSALAPAVPAIVVLLKITCVLLAALAATLIMPRASAGARHLVWLVAVGALLVLPPLAVWSPLPIRVLPEALAPAPAVSSNAPSIDLENGRAVDGVVATTSLPGGVPETAPLRTFPLGFGSTLLLMWLVVAIALIGRLLYGAWSVRRIVRRARPLEHSDWQTPLYQIADRMGLDGAPRLLQSDEVKMPFAAGLFTTWIVLPTDSEAWTAERRSAVLIHELGHVRRRDLIGHTMGRIVAALYWFHPLVWTAARRLRAESERACDDLALVFGARPSDYAEHLLDIVTCVRDHNTPAVALAMAHRKEFEGRMLAILNPELRRRGPSRLETVSLVGSLALLAVLVGAAAPVPRVSPAPTFRQTEADSRAKPDAPRHDAARQPVAIPVAPAAPKPSAAPATQGSPAPNPMNVAADQPDSDRAGVLARTLRTDASAEVRRVAAWGLGRYAETDVGSQALITSLGVDADPEVREMSAWALSRARRNSGASPALAKAVRQDKDAKVRATAVWAAGEIGEESAVPALVGVLADPDPDVRERAAWAIGTCHPDKAPVELLRALGDKDRDVRLSTAWALYNIRDPEAVDEIDAAFRVETDSEVQRGLIRALGSMGDRSVDALSKLVSSPDSTVRAVAVTALAGGSAGGPWPWPRPEPRPFP
jgi:beta-lactamase regulating signal transducer with metallopeptidase domain